MKDDHLRVNFDYRGSGVESITCTGGIPGMMLIKHLLDEQMLIPEPVLVCRGTNQVIPPFAMIGGFARHNSLLVAVYSCLDRVLIIDPEEGPPYLVEFDERTTVYDVKRKLREYGEVPIARQILTTKNSNRELPNDAGFSQLQLRRQMLSLRIRPETGSALRVCADQSVIVVPIQNADDQASDIRWAVAREIGESPKDFGLLAPSARLLDPNAKLWEAGVGAKSTLFVLPEEEETVPVVIASAGLSAEFELPISATVAVMRVLFETLSLVPYLPRRIFVNGELVKDDGALVSDLGIIPGSTIVVTYDD
jgi:hypothetical protein